MKTSNRRIVAWTVAWLLAAGSGMVALASYSGKPGTAAAAPARWPSESRIVRDAARPTLVVLGHPKCPCTRATLAELAKLADRLNGRAAIHVLFIHPEGTPADWERSDLWSQAEAIPGVEVSADPRAEEADRFGSDTSGQVLLYATDGRLVFSGGITLARGHQGDNPGAERIYEWVTRGHAEIATAPVFGCPLHDPVAQEVHP